MAAAETKCWKWIFDMPDSARDARREHRRLEKSFPQRQRGSHTVLETQGFVGAGVHAAGFQSGIGERGWRGSSFFMIIGATGDTGQTKQCAAAELDFTTGRSQRVFASDQLQLRFPWGQIAEVVSQSMLK